MTDKIEQGAINSIKVQHLDPEIGFVSIFNEGGHTAWIYLLYLQFAGGHQNIDYNSVWVQKAREPGIYNHQAALVHKN